MNFKYMETTFIVHIYTTYLLHYINVTVTATSFFIN